MTTTEQPKVAGKVEASAVRDLEAFAAKMLTIEAAFRDALPEGDALRESIHDLARQTRQTGRLLAYATDPELAKVATREVLYPAYSAPKS
ncbi:hypothetical protein [Botrimarina mediterranea]|uniref:hypothetical protein n=1 Tax=Botrimarina mediterranea TaxID=2528022 RepID=UPI001189A6B4|nr:hypothetical protein K2D_34840 [Planctomycetes bacterium K2D]